MKPHNTGVLKRPEGADTDWSCSSPGLHRRIHRLPNPTMKHCVGGRNHNTHTSLLSCPQRPNQQTLVTHSRLCVLTKSSLPSPTTSHLGGLEQGIKLLSASISWRGDEGRNLGLPYGSTFTRSSFGKRWITEGKSSCHQPMTQTFPENLLGPDPGL